MKGDFKLNLRPATPVMDALNLEFTKLFGPRPFPPIAPLLSPEQMAEGDMTGERA